MTKYLSPQPFSAPVSPGNLTTEEYFLRVGALVHCEECGKNVSAPHKCEWESYETVSLASHPGVSKQVYVNRRKRDQF